MKELEELNIEEDKEKSINPMKEMIENSEPKKRSVSEMTKQSADSNKEENKTILNS